LHDLRTPIYGLRNLFKNMQQYDLPGEEIKVLEPDATVIEVSGRK
jgi:hypothetical protein